MISQPKDCTLRIICEVQLSRLLREGGKQPAVLIGEKNGLWFRASLILLTGPRETNLKAGDIDQSISFNDERDLV